MGEDVLKVAFHFFDVDGNGRITQSDLMRNFAEDWILDVIPEVDTECVGAIDFDGFSALVRGCEDPAEVAIIADQVVRGPTEKTLQTNVTNLPLETVVSELSAVVDQLQSVACHATSNPGSESNLSSPLSAQATTP